jgi:5-methylcytosine-specific restriction endonuclease McrA
MPQRPPRRCPRCGGTLPSAARCPTCDHWRGSAAARGYTYTWSKYARGFLDRFPFCGMRMDGQFYAEHSLCHQRGERRRAQCVDHIVPIRAGGSIFNPTNHQALCFRCNRVKG